MQSVLTLYTCNAELYIIVPQKKSPKYVILDYYTFSYILQYKSNSIHFADALKITMNKLTPCIIDEQ